VHRTLLRALQSISTVMSSIVHVHISAKFLMSSQAASEASLEELIGLHLHRNTPASFGEGCGTLTRFSALRSLYLRRADISTMLSVCTDYNYPPLPTGLRRGRCSPWSIIHPAYHGRCANSSLNLVLLSRSTRIIHVWLLLCLLPDCAPRFHHISSSLRCDRQHASRWLRVPQNPARSLYSRRS